MRTAEQKNGSRRCRHIDGANTNNEGKTTDRIIAYMKAGVTFQVIICYILIFLAVITRSTWAIAGMIALAVPTVLMTNAEAWAEKEAEEDGNGTDSGL